MDLRGVLKKQDETIAQNDLVFSQSKEKMDKMLPAKAVINSTTRVDFDQIQVCMCGNAVLGFFVFVGVCSDILRCMHACMLTLSERMTERSKTHTHTHIYARPYTRTDTRMK